MLLKSVCAGNPRKVPPEGGESLPYHAPAVPGLQLPLPARRAGAVNGRKLPRRPARGRGPSRRSGTRSSAGGRDLRRERSREVERAGCARVHEKGREGLPSRVEAGGTDPARSLPPRPEVPGRHLALRGRFPAPGGAAPVWLRVEPRQDPEGVAL